MVKKAVKGNKARQGRFRLTLAAFRNLQNKNASLQAELDEVARQKKVTEADLVRANQARTDIQARLNDVMQQRDQNQRDFRAKEEELRRMVRMVDQFTSVQIIGHGQQLTPTTMTPQQPGALRLSQ